MLKIISKIFSISNVNQRSALLKKNMILNTIIKVLSILISFLLVPMSIKYIGEDNYGIWLTLSSVIIWLSFFDIGFNNGLRNKYAESKALNDISLLREYVSTTFFALSFIFCMVWIVAVFFNFFVDWTKLFNESLLNKTQDLSILFLLIISYFCLLSIFKLLGTILLADQRPSIAAFIDALGQLLCLLLIWLLMQIQSGTLLKLGVVFCVAPLFIWLVANIYFFRSDRYYKSIIPSIAYFKLSRVKGLLTLGGKFFVIQVAGLVQYQTANFIIVYYYTTTDVTYYNLVFKYFSAVTMFFSLFMTPLWSAVTDAYTKKEYEWIQTMVNRFLKLAVCFTLVCAFMFIVGNLVFKIWVGEDIANNINSQLMIWCCIYTIVMLYSTIYVHILNGMGILNVQFVLSLISPVLYIIIVYFLIGKLNIGVHALFIALLLSNLNGYVVPFQYYHIMRRLNLFRKGVNN